ncbi:hypothetical protein B0H10DRAFT_1188357 [Mycena sp. CBHHK59/15]|nr:hypothetical protein B0H10DRAFT_1188357 [Mycena sp. CBHHK59/15]
MPTAQLLTRLHYRGGSSEAELIPPLLHNCSLLSIKACCHILMCHRARHCCCLNSASLLPQGLSCMSLVISFLSYPCHPHPCTSSPLHLPHDQMCKCLSMLGSCMKS